MGICGEVALLIEEGVPEEIAWAEVAYSRGKMSKQEYDSLIAEFVQKSKEKSFSEEKDS